MNSDEGYRILEISPGSSLREIKAAYRQLAKVWHPDRFMGDPALAQKANDKLILINLAYNAILAAREGRSGEAAWTADEGEPWGDMRAESERTPASSGGVLRRWQSSVRRRVVEGTMGEIGPVRGRMEFMGSIIGALLCLILKTTPQEPMGWESLLLVPLGYLAGLLGGAFVLRWTVVLAIATTVIYGIAGGVYALLGQSSAAESMRMGISAGGTAGLLVLVSGTFLTILYRLLRRGARKRGGIVRRRA